MTEESSIAYATGYAEGWNLAINSSNKRDTALLRQALEALETTDEGDYGKQYYDTVKVEAAIYALKERLK